jgi:hypothetical protein
MLLTAFLRFGEVMEAVDTRVMKWQVTDCLPIKVISMEGEYMLVDEYDAFLENLTDFILQTYLPVPAEILCR